eukprot:Gb_15853 [translate_table: standard]
MGMTAHPKIDLETGELFAFQYGPVPPFLNFFRVAPSGEKEPDGNEIVFIAANSYPVEYVLERTNLVHSTVEKMQRNGTGGSGGGQVELVEGSSYFGQSVPFKMSTLSSNHAQSAPLLTALFQLKRAKKRAGQDAAHVTALDTLQEALTIETVVRIKSGAEWRKGARCRDSLYAAAYDFPMKWFKVLGFNFFHSLNAWDKGNEIVFIAANSYPVEHVLERTHLVHSTVEKNRYGYMSVGAPLPKISGVVNLDFERAKWTPELADAEEWNRWNRWKWWWKGLPTLDSRCPSTCRRFHLIMHNQPLFLLLWVLPDSEGSFKHSEAHLDVSGRFLTPESGAEWRKGARCRDSLYAAAYDFPMKWFKVLGFNFFHSLNAWDKGNEIVFIAANSYPVEHVLERTHLVHSTVEKNRYGYMSVGAPLPKISGVVKLDFERAKWTPELADAEEWNRWNRWNRWKWWWKGLPTLDSRCPSTCQRFHLIMHNQPLFLLLCKKLIHSPLPLKMS